MGRRVVWLFCGLVGIGGCSDKASAPPPEMLKGSLLLSDSKEALAAGMVRTQFNFSQIRDLWVRAQVPKVARPITHAKLTFLAPQGDVFLEETKPYSDDPATQTMPMNGVNHPVMVYLAVAIPGGFALDRSIPIAGGLFERYPNPGVWTVQASIDGYEGTISTPMEVKYQR